MPLLRRRNLRRIDGYQHVAVWKIEGHGTLVDSAITFGRQHMHDRQSPKDLVSGEHPEAAGLCPDAAQRETTNNFIRPVDGASAAGNFDPSTEMCMETEGPR